jgi:hypothetical protein
MPDTPESEGAKAGEGPAESDRATAPKGRRRINKRPRIVLDHPDITGPEFTIRRSFRIQDGIERFLEENVGTAWESVREIHIRAANYVWHLGLLKRRPSLVTAGRWIDQYTAVGEKYRLSEVRGEGYWLIERRG